MEQETTEEKVRGVGIYGEGGSKGDPPPEERTCPANSGQVLPGASFIGMERREESLELWSGQV